MKIDWKRKLTSRKLWVSVTGLVTGLILIFGGSQENADKISGVIISAASVLAYTIGEGLADSSHSVKEDNDGSDI